MSKHALITGITGQDGSYLAELLLEQGYEVYGIMRRKSVVDYGNVEHIKDKIHFIYADMTDVISLISAMRISQADEVYNLAAQSFVATSWEQPLANIQMMPSVQMCGFLYTGADLCGFAGDTTPDLALRWLEFGLFTPLMRNHAGAGTREQEYFRFADQLPALREMLRLRYALLPYLYSEFMKSALENTGYFRPLGFDWPADPEAREVQDQLLLGDGVMLAPVYTQNAAGRHVYLPEPMQLYRLRSAEDYDTEALPAGHHYVHCALNEVLLFVRPGHAVPLAKPAACTAALDEQPIALLACPDADGHAAYRMYTDDGETMDPEHDGHWTVLDASR